MSLSHILALLCALLFTLSFTYAQNPPVAPANYDEAKVPKFELTNPLKTTDGRIVDSPKLWNETRRPELLKSFEEQMFGKSPLHPTNYESMGFALTITDNIGGADSTVFNGKGTRYQIRIRLVKLEQQERPKEGDPTINVLVYTPNNVNGNTPLFVGLNFRGNHTVATDPGIELGAVWNNGKSEPAKEEERGSMASRWQIEKILDRGYAVATAYYEDIEPDFDGGSKFGVRKMINMKDESNGGNAIATWAWGLTQIYNIVVGVYGERLNIAPTKIAVIGHSRLGKTALWAGATNPEFALVISNNSGCGGAALSRREFGETVHRINTAFPHWFCGNFKKYNHDVNALPFDQHELIALIAPRPVYIASAVEDCWADPKGEFLSGLYADPVYRLLGTDGIAGVTEMPPINTPVGGTIGYHIRTGVHDVTEYDWEQYLNFADKHFK